MRRFSNKSNGSTSSDLDPHVLDDDNVEVGDDEIADDASFGTHTATGSLGTKTTSRDDITGRISSLVSRSGSAVSIMLFLTAALVVSSTYVFLTRTKVAEFEKAVRVKQSL